jgi:hypothetical protein
LSFGVGLRTPDVQKPTQFFLSAEFDLSSFTV